MTKILAILAHCDDEVVCGWPVLQNMGYERHLLVIATQEKGYGALRAVCEGEGINLIEHSGFRNRFSEVETIKDDIGWIVEKAVEKVKPDIIYTHNAVGEYGHIDHLFLNELVVTKFVQHKEIITSDIKIRSEIWPKRIIKMEGEFTTAEMDVGFWDRCKSEYEKRDCWTTNMYIRRSLLTNRVRLYKNKCPQSGITKKKVVWLCDVSGWAFANQAAEIGRQLPDYVHTQVVLKFNKANPKFIYSKEDKVAIKKADIVVAMTPSALGFTDRRDKIITRLSGVRST